jgi:hypothetical protein
MPATARASLCVLLVLVLVLVLVLLLLLLTAALHGSGGAGHRPQREGREPQVCSEGEQQARCCSRIADHCSTKLPV